MSKLKSTWDAVNELRGDLTGATYVNTHKENYKTLDDYLHVVLTNDYASQPIGSFVIYSANESARGDVRFICTIEEFNKLVEEMTLGLDVNPVNHGHYLNYVDADKTLLEKENNPLVYTQEMADNGELPSVGMECMAYIYAGTSKQGNPMNSWVDGEFIGKCKSSNGGFCFVFKAKDDIHHVINANSHFKPIDTRTKKEKAIDEYIQSQHYGPVSLSQSIKTIMKNAFEAGVEWVGE